MLRLLVLRLATVYEEDLSACRERKARLALANTHQLSVLRFVVCMMFEGAGAYV